MTTAQDVPIAIPEFCRYISSSYLIKVLLRTMVSRSMIRSEVAAGRKLGLRVKRKNLTDSMASLMGMEGYREMMSAVQRIQLEG